MGLEEGDFQGAQEAFDRALTIAQRENDTNLEMRTLESALITDWVRIRWQKILERGRRPIELARSVDDRRAELQPLFYTGVGMWCTGDLEGARMQASAVLTLAEELQIRFPLAQAYLGLKIVRLPEGDWQAARDCIERGLSVSPQEHRLLFCRALIEYEKGDFKKGDDYLGNLLEVMPAVGARPTPAYVFPIMVLPMIARIPGSLDRLEIAEKAGDTILSWPLADTQHHLYANGGKAMMAVLRGEAAATAEQYAALESQRGTMFTMLMSVDRLLGLPAQTMAELDQAAEHFGDALAFCREAAYRPELAWTCCD